VVLLVGLAEEAELTLACEAEEVEEVERALHARLGPVLDVVRDIEELPETRAHPAGDGLFDPVDNRHPIEFPTALRRRVEGRGVARGRSVAVDLLPDLLEVVGDVVYRVRGAFEVAPEVGAVRLRAEEVVEREPQLVHEISDRVVTLVDQLAAVLGDLSVGEGAACAPAPSAQTVGRLVDLSRISGLFEAIRARQAREARADDDDARRRGSACGGRQPTKRRERDRAGAGALDQAAAGSAQRVGRDGGDGILEDMCDRCTHLPAPLSTTVAPSRIGSTHASGRLRREEARSA